MASWVVRMGWTRLISITEYRPPEGESLLVADPGGSQKLLQS